MFNSRPRVEIPLPDTEGMQSKFKSRRGWTGSPLTTKIIAFNLVAVSLLFSGILFLNQSRDSLISLRSQTLKTEALILANALSFHMDALGNHTLLDENIAEVLMYISMPANSRAQLFAANGTPISELGSAEIIELSEGARTDSFGDILDDAWSRLSAVTRQNGSDDDDVFMAGFRADVARRAMFTDDIVQTTGLNSVQQSILTVGSPVYFNERTVGAVVLTTVGGEIDGFVRGERLQILKVFLLAMVISVLLSFILANTIGRPLRLLTEAAARGSLQKSGKVNPRRINIPDLTARPDEIGELSRQLRNMTTALYDRIDANASFAADVAHEIKNPLTSLGSAVETMQYAKTDEMREKLLNVLRDDVKRMDRLVTDISNASRLDSELAKEDLEIIDLNTMLGNLVEYQAELASEQGVGVLADLPSETLNIPGIEGRLAQVFVNLITNAVSFVPEAGHVKVILRANDDMVTIAVEDTGTGIPKDNLEDVFKRFYSSRPEQEFGNNSGLGLAISKQIIEAHGGEIWAENIYVDDDQDVPTGAKFTVTLPR